MFSAYLKSNSTLPSLLFLQATAIELLLMVGRFGKPSMFVLVPNNSGCGNELFFLLVEGIASSLLEQIEPPSGFPQPITREKFLCYHATFTNPSVVFFHYNDAHIP
jgi:hypothetical protein